MYNQHGHCPFDFGSNITRRPAYHVMPETEGQNCDGDMQFSLFMQNQWKSSNRPFHIAPIWLWGSQSAPRTHLAIARAVCKATAMNQLYGSWFFGSRLPFSALAPRAGLQYISSRIFWWKWISGNGFREPEPWSRGWKFGSMRATAPELDWGPKSWNFGSQTSSRAESQMAQLCVKRPIKKWFCLKTECFGT